MHKNTLLKLFFVAVLLVPIIVIVSRVCAVVGDINPKVLRCNSVSNIDKIIANILGSFTHKKNPCKLMVLAF